jgi:hypothetical protein
MTTCTKNNKPSIMLDHFHASAERDVEALFEGYCGVNVEKYVEAFAPVILR